MKLPVTQVAKDDFIRLVTADQPDAPPYFTYDAILNTRERATLDKALEEGLKPVELDEESAFPPVTGLTFDDDQGPPPAGYNGDQGPPPNGPPPSYYPPPH